MSPLMRDRSYLLKAFYWKRLLYRAAVRRVIRPLVARRDLPLVTVTGTNGKTGLTLLVTRIFEDAGYRTAGVTTEGVRIGGRWVTRGDQAGAKGLWRAHLDLGVQAVVAETARGGLLRTGPGFSACDVSVVTNVTENHLGFGGIDTLEQMADLKATLPRLTRPSGVAVLNYDQPLVRDMARVTAARVVYYSMREPPGSVRECFFYRDGAIHRRRATTEDTIISVDRIFLTYGGAVAFQVAATMAALAAVEAMTERLPVPRASLESTLASFGRNARDLPGRMQLFRYRDADLLLSAAKNPETYAQELPLLRRLARARGSRKIVGILTEVGNRHESHYREISRLVGEGVDEIVCVPPSGRYLRGRSSDEIVRLLGSEVPTAKLSRASDGTFDGIVASARDTAEPTLFVAFCAFACSAIDVAKVVEHGELLPLRFAV
jgi:cyanophycin synthetase